MIGSMPVTRSISAARLASAPVPYIVSTGHQRAGTLALRIQFKGQNGQKVSRTSQDDIQSLVPWLKGILTTLHLPYPKSTNVMKSFDTSNVIEMFWDAVGSTAVRAHVLHPPFCSDSM